MNKGITLLLGLVIVFTLRAQDINQFHGLTFRSIGPAGMSGRITSIDVVESNNSIIYAGSSAGGLWKSNNAGISFTPIFEGQKTASVGDVSIFQKNPNIIYLGTGEGNPRNTQYYGYGMYKSIDGGKSWKHLGLEGTKNIHRVIIHPDNPDMVWVGAQGPAWGPSAERGVFKTTNGGQTWQKILYTNESTGVADMIIDPSNPNKLIVAMWEFRRQPWTMTSGGAGSAIHVTNDGGDNWVKQSAANGLPEGMLGRIGLAIARNNPNVVYANVEAEKENALYRSSNGGSSWMKTTNKGVGDRPFYYNDIEVDPTNENRVYHVATTVSISEDGGKSFKPMLDFFGGVHSDHHAFWINPSNPSHILDGNDGGLYASYDMGKKWKFHHNIPVGQFYHINVDNEIPYNVYGGMQDNGSWTGPAYKYTVAGLGPIYNDDFKSVGFGDGFDVIPDPNDSRYGYSMSQGGEFQRYDRATGVVQGIKPQSDTEELRFNWNAALAVDPTTPGVIYGGSQFVHKSSDKGQSWEIISPDLTTKDPEKQKQSESGGLTIDNSTAENHTTITVIEPSKLEKGLLWVGTDDGNVQLTQDGGTTWTNVISNIKGVPANAWVTQIKHSSYNEGEAFVVFDDHRRDNWTPYIFRTKNYGKSWERLVDESDVWGYTLCFVQDPIEPNLMFVGTEFGLYVSFDGGEAWQKWKADFPTVSTMDAVIHPTEHDLVVATFGRSVFVLDDIRPLREAAANKAILDKGLHLFEIPSAYQAIIGLPDFFRGADDSFKGQNRTHGALISYYSDQATAKDGVVISIADAEGNEVRSIKTTAKPGINRTNWDLKTQGGMVPGKPDIFAMFFMGGANVMYGDYTVTVMISDASESQPLEVRKDPAMPISDEQFQTNIDRKNSFLALAGEVLEVYKRVEGTSAKLGGIKGIVAADSALSAEVDEAIKTATALKFRFMPKPSKNALTSGDKDMRNRLLALAGFYFNLMIVPDENSQILTAQIKKEFEQLKTEVEDFEKNTIERLKTKVAAC
ncbi:MAG: hypothetical protein AAGC88_14255, partial [Bacteroidota bacterium]